MMAPAAPCSLGLAAPPRLTFGGTADGPGASQAALVVLPASFSGLLLLPNWRAQVIFAVLDLTSGAAPTFTDNLCSPSPCSQADAFARDGEQNPSTPTKPFRLSFIES